jgi:hypothetical protein
MDAMNRRQFLRRTVSGLVIVVTPTIFLPPREVFKFDNIIHYRGMAYASLDIALVDDSHFQYRQLNLMCEIAAANAIPPRLLTVL